MKIAVTSQNFRTVTAHAGRARRFILFDARPGVAPTELQRLDVAPEQAPHTCGSVAPALIGSVDVILSAGFSRNFAAAMRQHGIVAATTDVLDPVEAVQDFLVRHAAGTLRPISGCDCSGDCHDGPEAHDHHHDDDA